MNGKVKVTGITLHNAPATPIGSTGSSAFQVTVEPVVEEGQPWGTNVMPFSFIVNDASMFDVGSSYTLTFAAT